MNRYWALSVQGWKQEGHAFCLAQLVNGGPPRNFVTIIGRSQYHSILFKEFDDNMKLRGGPPLPFTICVNALAVELR